jgi:prepilin-type N-terminal cleavage/methylation domain-containing protein
MPFQRRAMSMIELTIVLLIVGITAAVAAPRLADTVRAMRLRAAANQLAAHIDYVRSVALNEARTTTLVFDNSLDHYLCDDVLLPDQPGQPFYFAVREVHDPSFDLTADFDSRSELSFDFEGVPTVNSTPMESGTVILGYGKEQYQVAIAAGTGQTTVSRLGGQHPAPNQAAIEP